MQNDQQKALLFDLADTLLKSWWTIVAGICLGLSGSLVALALTQELFMATAKIYVTPEISRELGRPIVADDMTRRMAAMEDAVLGERQLQRVVAEVYGLPEDPLLLQSRIRRVRRNVTITPTAIGGATGAEALWAFDLSYTDTKPERAALAANLLAETYIEQNSEMRTTQAQDAAGAAEQQANVAKAEFDAADRKLIEYRERHRFETGDHQDANLRLMERRQGELENARESLRAAENRLSDLHARLSEAQIGATSTAAEVLRLRRELDDLLVQYSEQHPKVVRVRRQLDEALAALGGAEPEGDAGQTYPTHPEVLELQGQIQAIEREIAAIREREAALRTEIGEYERRIAAVPQVQPQLSRLETEHSMLRQRYEKLRATADQTRQSAFLEQTLRGERFELTERAEVPLGPFYPEPKRFHAMGVLAGLLLFVGPVFAWRFLNPVISSESGLRALSDVPVLVTIPRVETPTTQGYRVRQRVKNFALSTLCTAVAIAAFVMLG